MTNSTAYQCDLAYIHDQGFGGFARGSAPGLLDLLRQAGIHRGRIIDLGCGSGIWARESANAGYEVIGVDISPAMIEIARRRVPAAAFHVASFLQFPFPPCQAITALGEVFNYLFDADNSLRALQDVCSRAFDALASGGVLIFDVAQPERCRGLSQSFKEGSDWACLVEYQHDAAQQRLTRRIVMFRKIGNTYRRNEETHHLQLYEDANMREMLERIGFRVRCVRSYGEYPLADGLTGFVATK